MVIPKTWKVFNQSHLRIIAMISMVLDHTYKYIIYPSGIVNDLPLFQRFFEISGRLAFPLFSFFLVEGFLHTSDVNKYLKRLVIWAFITEIPMNVLMTGQIFYVSRQSILFTFVIALLMLKGIKQIEEVGEKQEVQKHFWLLMELLVVLFSGFMAEILMTDYGAVVVFLVYFYYAFRDRLWVVALLAYFIFSAYNIWGIISIVMIQFYNDERGKQYPLFNYGFYPGHMIMIYLSTLILNLI